MLQFNICLRSADGSGGPLSYSLSTDQKAVRLSPLETTPATFILSLPDFLAQRKLYLGEVYLPQMLVNGKGYFLQKTNQNNVYLLTEEPHCSLFGFSLLNPKSNWADEDVIEKIYFENFTPGDATHYSLESKNLSGSLTSPPTACLQSCDKCGDVCPDQFKCGSQCTTTLGGLGFGIRGDKVVYTYKVSPDKKSVKVAAVDPMYITADLETPDLVRERYFFIDEEPTVGGSYPIYIWVDGEKRYLSQPNRLAEMGPTVYQLTPAPEEGTAQLAPTVVGNWREHTFTPNDFINLAFNNTPKLALWRDFSFQGQPAVTSKKVTSYNNAFALPKTETQGSSQGTQWWYWLLLGLIILVLIIVVVVLVYFLTRPKPERGVYVFSGENSRYFTKQD